MKTNILWKGAVFMKNTATRHVDTGIIQRGKTYRFTVYLGYDCNGKQIRKTTTFAPPVGISMKKADKLAREEYINFRNRCKGCYMLKEHMRFSELAKEYLQLYAANKLKPITVYNYEKHINYHFIDYFGNKKLKDITPAVINHFFASHKTMRHGEMKTLSHGNAKKLYCILQSMFKFAVSQGYLRETPCRNVILPSKVFEQDKNRKHLTIEELPEFLSLFQEYSSLNTIIYVLLFTGMRSGECLGLQWNDIDFENKKIYIRHTLSDVAGNHFLTSTKTRTSARCLFMSRGLTKLLKNHQLEQKKLEERLGEPFLHPEMVFTSATGNYKKRSCLYSSFKHLLKGTKFEFMTLHKLRHTNATLLLNSGIDLKIVSEHLGHSDIGVTADIYTDVLDNSRLETANIMEQLLVNTR